MNKLVFGILLFLAPFHFLFGQNLGIVYFEKSNLNDLIEHPDVQVHYTNNVFALVSTNSKAFNFKFIESVIEEADHEYYIVYKNLNHTSTIDLNPAEVLLDTIGFFIVKVRTELSSKLSSARHDGVVRVDLKNSIYKLNEFKSSSEIVYEQYIKNYLNEVNKDSIRNRILRLQNYGTRDAYSTESVLAEAWIKSLYESYGLNVEIMDFEMPAGEASDNVIALKTGIKYPEEFVVLGAHYDSRSRDVSAPGADDNASGTSGVLEIARILSQYEFDRSIIFCSFSGEEYGLYGSAAYAKKCKNEEKNIIAYFNMDMIGYLKSNDLKDDQVDLHTDLIYPSSAQGLADFYKNVCSIYLSDFHVYDGNLLGGDSDHTSFNQQGYAGLFPFEDDTDYSPYIHSENDVLGLSVNNMDLAEKMTQAILANVVVLANSSGVLNSVKDSEIENSISIYPNPTKGEFYVNVPFVPEFNIEVISLNGTILFKSRIKSGDNIQVNFEETGIYFLKISFENQVYMKKIIYNSELD